MANPSEMDPNDFLMGGGYPSAKFKEIGASVTGFIVRMDSQQQTDPKTREPKVWNDGSPRMQVRVVLQTEERDPENEDDSGLRAVYVKGQMRSAVADAVRIAKQSGLEVGGKLRVTFVRNGAVTNRALDPAKEYEAQYRPPAVSMEEPARAQTNGHSQDQPFDPQPVPRQRDEARQPVHDPAPF